jgi:hypothetical protein
VKSMHGEINDIKSHMSAYLKESLTASCGS